MHMVRVTLKEECINVPQDAEQGDKDYLQEPRNQIVLRPEQQINTL